MRTIDAIQDGKGRTLVSAREFFGFTSSKEDFREWMAKRIIEYEMTEGKDFELYITDEAARYIMKIEPGSFNEQNKDQI